MTWNTTTTRLKFSNILFIFVFGFVFLLYRIVYSVFMLFCVLFLILCCFFPILVQVYRPLPPGGNPTAVNKYHRHHHHHKKTKIAIVHRSKHDLPMTGTFSHHKAKLFLQTSTVTQTLTKNRSFGHNVSFVKINIKISSFVL